MEKKARIVGIIMGSQSDRLAMLEAKKVLGILGVPSEAIVRSAHRTPAATLEYVLDAEKRGVVIFIAGAGGAAHLAGLIAANTQLPVLGVPMESASLKGMDSLLSTVQMPGGIPVATFAIGKPGAINAALFAAAILALSDDDVRDALAEYRETQRQNVLNDDDPEHPKVT